MLLLLFVELGDLLFLTVLPVEMVSFSVVGIWIFGLMVLCTVVFIIPILVHLDSPASSDAFLLTRPVDHKALLLLKITIILSIGVLFPSIGEFIAVMKAGLPVSSLPRAFLLFITQYAAITLPFVLCAGATKKYSDYATVAGTLGLVAYAAWHTQTNLGSWGLRAFYFAPTFATAQTIAATDSLYAQAIYIVVAAVSGFAAYIIHQRSQVRLIKIALLLGVLAVAGIETQRVLMVRQGLNANTELAEVSVKPINPSVVIGKSANSNSSSEEKVTMRFSIPVSGDFNGELPYLLRFREFSIVDDTGKTFQVPLQNLGVLPCIEAPVLEGYLTSLRGHETKLKGSLPCELGEEYTLPKDAKLSGDHLPKVFGVAFGFRYSLFADYAIDLKAKEPTPSSAIRALPYHGLFGGLVTSGYESRTLAREIQFLPPLITSPIYDSRMGSPLYAHWYASPKTYVLINRDTNEGIRYWSPTESWNATNFSYVHMDEVSLWQSTDYRNEPPIPEELKNNGILYKISPRIKGSFVTNITLENVPIVHETTSNPEE